MTLSLPVSLPGPCPVCGEMFSCRDGRLLHQGHCDGYNQCLDDVVAWLMELDRRLLQEGKATGSACYLANAVRRGDAFGAGRQ